MKECLSLHHVAECCGICHVTVCEQPDHQLSVKIQWKNDRDLFSEQTILCASSCKSVHDLMIANGIETTLADEVCSQLRLS